MTIQEIIATLDALGAKKATVGTDEAFQYWKDYNIALHNSYESLRRAVIAGTELAKAVEEMSWKVPTKGEPIVEYGIEMVERYYRWTINNALAAYRAAIEDSSK